jgi:hypothetical protein
MEEQTSNGVGIFSEILAFCLATEEQGRNSRSTDTFCYLYGIGNKCSKLYSEDGPGV